MIFLQVEFPCVAILNEDLLVVAGGGDTYNVTTDDETASMQIYLYNKSNRYVLSFN